MRRPVEDDLRRRILSSSVIESADLPETTPPLDLMPQLQRSGPSIVKTRTGSVLSRGFILKTDYYPSGAPLILVPYDLCMWREVLKRRCKYVGRALDLDINVHGAPNFRAPRQGNLNVYGVAQPRTQGLRAILSVLRCRPDIPNPTRVVWFCTREEPLGTCRLILLRCLCGRGPGRRVVRPLVVERVLIVVSTKCTYPVDHSSYATPLSRDKR